MLSSMKTVSVKTKINQLVSRYKTYDAVAGRLGVSRRWVIYLAKGERKASSVLARVIDMELGKDLIQ